MTKQEQTPSLRKKRVMRWWKKVMLAMPGRLCQLLTFAMDRWLDRGGMCAPPLAPDICRAGILLDHAGIPASPSPRSCRQSLSFRCSLVKLYPAAFPTPKGQKVKLVGVSQEKNLIVVKKSSSMREILIYPKSTQAFYYSS